MNEGYSLCLNKWALDKDIKNELGLLLIISSLCAEKGYCYATNKYLADLFEITEVSVSTKLKKLEKKNYVVIDYKKRGCEVISREIRLKNFLIDDYNFFKSTIKENFKDNNIIINNKNNNNIYSQVVNYLNDKTKQNYKATTNKTITLIKARINEGFTLNDFKKVIDNKSQEWMGTDMEKYLRPETLFGTKFEGYLNQRNKKVPEWFDKDIKKEVGDDEYEELAKQYTRGYLEP